MVCLRVAGEYSPATLLKRDAGQHFRLNLCDLASPDFSAARLVGAAGESGTTPQEIRGCARGASACRAALPCDVPPPSRNSTMQHRPRWHELEMPIQGKVRPKS